jgi:dipeptidase D
MDFAKKTLDFFTDFICPTPRASYHEDLIAGKLVDFAGKHGLAYVRDRKNNVIIYKPATGKYVGTPTPVILQAHTDMICVPTSADFSRGVEAYYSEDNRLTGRSAVTREKTSLGADDGIGVAAIMAVLDGGDDIIHPPLIAVFTAEEECGLTGARDISVDDITGIATGLDFGGAAFINLDDGRFGQFSVGCAGSANVTVRVPVSRMGFVPGGAHGMSCFELAVGGLSGGHSGLCIHEKRGNANVLLCTVIRRLYHSGVDALVYGLGRCGDASNAIPSTASAYIAVPAEQEGMLRKQAAEAESMLKDTYREFDPGVRVEVRESPEAKAAAEAAAKKPSKKTDAKTGNDGDNERFHPDTCEFDDGTPYSPETVSDLTILAAEKLGSGPVAYSGAAHRGLVETSFNLGIMRDEGRHISMVYMVRSSIDAEREKTVGEIFKQAKIHRAEAEAGSRSPGWAYREESPLRDLFLNKYRELFDGEAAAAPVHAGLECGHFAEKFGRFKGMDFISCGPTITEIHSVNETLHTETVEKFGRLLVAVLGSLYAV